MRGFSKTQVAGFFLTGAAAGATLALLFAPKTGAQTRRDIRKFSKKTLCELDYFQQHLREQISQGYQQPLEVFDNVKDYVQDGKNKLQKMIKTV